MITPILLSSMVPADNPFDANPMDSNIDIDATIQDVKQSTEPFTPQNTSIDQLKQDRGNHYATASGAGIAALGAATDGSPLTAGGLGVGAANEAKQGIVSNRQAQQLKNQGN